MVQFDIAQSLKPLRFYLREHSKMLKARVIYCRRRVDVLIVHSMAMLKRFYLYSRESRRPYSSGADVAL